MTGREFHKLVDGGLVNLNGVLVDVQIDVTLRYAVVELLRVLANVVAAGGGVCKGVLDTGA